MPDSSAKALRSATIFVALVLLLASVEQLHAQKREAPDDPVRLCTESVDEHGTRPYGVDGGEVAARLLYVKVAPRTDVADLDALRARLSSSGLAIARVASYGRITAPPHNQNLSVSSPDPRAIAEYLLARILVVEFSSDLAPEVAAQVLSRVDLVEIAEPVPIPRIFGGATPAQPDDPMLSEQKQVPFIHADEAWVIESGDSSVVVGVVDAGVTARHEDLWNNIAVNWGEAGPDSNGNPKESNGVDDDENGYVDDWKGVNLVPGDEVPPGETANGEHGTQVAGYVGATTNNGLGVAGIGNQCRFFPMKAARKNSQQLAGGFNGILYAARNGFRVVNCSWGQPVSSEVEQEIINLAVYGYDIAVVAAGGNDYAKIRFFPAGYRNVLGVAGVNDLQSVTTTWGEHIDVVARAGLTTSDLNLYYDLSSASSYATPVVSGVVALVRAHWPELSAPAALEHVRLTSIPIDNFNLGREGFIGHGRVDALQALSTDPLSHPGLVVDSVWAVDGDGNRTDSLREGESGRMMISVTNLLGPAKNATVRASLYTDDSTGVTLPVDSLFVGDLGTGETWISSLGFPFSVDAPGRRSIPVRFRVESGQVSDIAYELVPVRRTYTILSGSDISISITSNGKLAVDYSEGEAVGEGLVFNGRQQIYESGLIVATDRQHLLDNVRNDSPAEPNDDFVAISPTLFPLQVTSAVGDREGTSDYVGLRIGTRGELFANWPNLLRVGYFVENRSGMTIDSLRLGLFADWDLDEFSDGQRVEETSVVGLPDSLFPVVGRISSGVITTTYVAVESGSRRPGEGILPIFYAILNGGDPLVIYDGFSDEEKYRTLSNGIGNREAGPGDVSLVSGGVMRDLLGGETDSLFLLIEFVEGGEEPTAMVEYSEAKYGISGVNASAESGSLLTTFPNPATTYVTLRGENLTSVELVDARGVSRLISTVPAGTNSLRLSTEGLPSGEYILQVTIGSTVKSIPIVILR